MPEGAEVANLRDAHSWAGATTSTWRLSEKKERQAAELLAECKAAMGKVFCGYKGGDYVMGALTPVWLASYGCCGPKLMALHAGGEIETAADD